jgi:polyferredoxin
MSRLLIVLVLIALLFSLSFALHVLLWVAVFAFVLWCVGFVVRPRGGGRRWYYW